MAARTSQKQKVWLAKQQLCTCITLFCTFLCGHCTTTAWKSLISRFMEDVNKRQRLEFFFLFQNLVKKLTPGKFSYIWHFPEIGIRATKFEKARIHFKSDVFAAVAVVNAAAGRSRGTPCWEWGNEPTSFERVLSFFGLSSAVFASKHGVFVTRVWQVQWAYWVFNSGGATHPPIKPSHLIRCRICKKITSCFTHLKMAIRRLSRRMLATSR